MARWQGRSKRLPTGARLKRYRKKRKYELGRESAETRMGEEKKKTIRVRGGRKKIRLLLTSYANVTDPKTGQTQKVKINEVETNPANIDYSRRGIITKGAIIITELGKAMCTSRPGQHGVVNAILLTD